MVVGLPSSSGWRVALSRSLVPEDEYESNRNADVESEVVKINWFAIQAIQTFIIEHVVGLGANIQIFRAFPGLSCSSPLQLFASIISGEF